MSFPADARHAVHLLLKHRGFTAAALVTLALCIGANTAIFSILNSVLLRPLPFEGAERLVHVYNSYPLAGVERGGAAAPDYYDRQALPAFEHVAMFTRQGVTIGDAGRPERTVGLAVTPSLFATLGAGAAVGRTFLAEEGEPGSTPTVVLSWPLWQERFGGSAEAIGATLRLDDVDHTVVGVMPTDFVFHDPAVHLWTPLTFSAAQRGDEGRHANNWTMIARLRPGVALEQAQQQIDLLNARTVERLPQFSTILQQVGFHTVVASYRDDLIRDIRSTLWLLQAGVLLVLLVGCVNIANLVLVRATARRAELATRAAIGATPGRLVQQLVTESLVLAIAGGVLGVAVGWAALLGFSTFSAQHIPRGTEVAIDGSVLAVVLSVCVVVALLFSALPIARVLRSDLSAITREESRTGTAGRATGRWRGALVAAQVAVAFTVLAGAGLMMVSYARTLAVNTGFRPEGVVTASVSLPVTRYPNAAARREFTQRLLDDVRARPGVRLAAATAVLPMSDELNASAVTPEGYVARPEDALVAPVNSRVSDGYFETMGIRLVAGRTFTPGDDPGAPRVAIVDRYLAEHFWPGQDPLGRRVTLGVPGPDDDPEYQTVVGVVEEVRAQSLTGEGFLGHYYLPLAQHPMARIFLVVTGAGTVASHTASMRDALAAIDPDLPLYDVRTMSERVAESVVTERLRTVLLAAFGGLALLLAGVGLYAVLAYAVTQRRVEIGIRMALGSTAEAIFRMVVGQGVKLVAIGLGAGLVASFALRGLVRTMLYDVTPGDPLVLGGVLVVLSATALAACLLPARRAMRVNPLAAIRDRG